MTIQNITEWQLFHLAQALTRAKRLEKQRTDFHDELYAAIRYPTVHYDKEYMGNMGSPATDVQAIRIIEMKERYERKIKQEYGRYEEWLQLLATLKDEEKLIMIRYFQKRKHIPKHIICRKLDDIAGRIRSHEMKVSKVRKERSTAEYKEYQEQTRSFRKPLKSAIELSPQKQYLINGKLVYMESEDYALYQQREEERKQLWEMDHEEADIDRKERKLKRRETLFS